MVVKRPSLTASSYSSLSVLWLSQWDRFDRDLRLVATKLARLCGFHHLWKCKTLFLQNAPSRTCILLSGVQNPCVAIYTYGANGSGGIRTHVYRIKSPVPKPLGDEPILFPYYNRGSGWRQVKDLSNRWIDKSIVTLREPSHFVSRYSKPWKRSIRMVIG